MKKSLRSYQQDILNTIVKDLEDNDKIVMAMCPNSGKTFTSIKLMEELIQNHGYSKILVLAHGTTVLRKQFYENLMDDNVSPNFSFSKVDPFERDFSGQVVVAIPQSLKRSDISQFDLVVVDEAHERYFSKEISVTLQLSLVKKHILLTGTPSKFIYKNSQKKIPPFLIRYMAMSDMDPEHMSNVNAVICTSAYNIAEAQFNENSQDVVSNTNIFNNRDTKLTIDIFLKDLLRVMKLKNIRNTDNVLPAGFLKKLGKTMFICREQGQADCVNKYLNDNGIPSVISTAKVDPDSNNIALFQDDPSIKALVVLRRGILGFSMDSLENLVDMGGTRNLDVMYQSFSRLTRTHPTIKSKRFFKIAPKYMVEYTEYNVGAMLSLTRRDIMKVYNGKNFLTDVPIFINKKNKSTRSINGDDRISTLCNNSDLLVERVLRASKSSNPVEDIQNLGVSKTKAKIIIRAINESNLKASSIIENIVKPTKKQKELKSYDGLSNSITFNKLYYKSDKPFQVYSNVTLCEVQKQFGDRSSMPDGYWNLKTCTDAAKMYNTMGAFASYNREAYLAACDLNILKEVCGHLMYGNMPDDYWNLKTCTEAAKMYNNRVGFKLDNKPAYDAACKLDILDEVCKHMGTIVTKPKDYWNYETCAKEAKLYKNRSGFKYGNAPAYNKACNLDILEDICKHMKSKQKPRGYWDYETCAKEAKLYKSRGEFEKGNGSAYVTASKLGIMEEICKHMVRKCSKRKIQCLESGEVFESIAQAARKLDITKYNISDMLSGKCKTAKGFTFKYTEE